MQRVVLGFSIVALFAAAAFTAAPAGADCAGPTIQHDGGEVDRGGPITVTGSSFGDNCHDTGPPPEGEGILGRPLTDIRVVMTQDATEIVVAHGDADEDYGFEVTVFVPIELDPGAAEIRVSWGGDFEAFLATEVALVISDAPPIADATRVVTFGPAESTPTSTTPGPETTSSPADPDPSTTTTITGISTTTTVAEVAEGGGSGDGSLTMVAVVVAAGVAAIAMGGVIRRRVRA